MLTDFFRKAMLIGMLKKARYTLERERAGDTKGICLALCALDPRLHYTEEVHHQIDMALKQASRAAQISTAYYAGLWPEHADEEVKAGRLLWLDQIIAWAEDPSQPFPPPPEPPCPHHLKT